MRSLSFLIGVALLATLVQAGQEEAILGKKPSEWLKILKTHKETRFRRAAVLALGTRPTGPGVLPGLLDALENDPEAELRREIASYLGTLGVDGKGTVEGLAQRVAKDKNDKVRESAARSLGKLAEYAPIHAMTLGRALKDPSPETRAAAAEALKNFGAKAKLVLPQLVEAAQDPKQDRFTRLYAVQILSKQAGDDEKTAKVFADIVADREAPATLRQAAVVGLGTMGPTASDTVGQLAGLVADSKQDLELRRAGAVALGKMGAKASTAWPAVQKLLQDPDTGLRYQAVRLSGTLGKNNPEATKLLIQRLAKEQNNEVLLAVIQELGELGAREALDSLTRISSDDPRQSIRDAAEASVKKIKGL